MKLTSSLLHRMDWYKTVQQKGRRKFACLLFLVLMMIIGQHSGNCQSKGTDVQDSPPPQSAVSGNNSQGSYPANRHVPKPNSDPQVVAAFQKKWDDLRAMMHRDLFRMDVCYISGEPRFAINASKVETDCDRKLEIGALISWKRSVGLDKAMGATQFMPTTAPDYDDYQWAIVFYDENDKRLLAVDIAASGKFVTIDGTRAQLNGPLFSWLRKEILPIFE